jgi:hypothetical protein
MVAELEKGFRGAFARGTMVEFEELRSLWKVHEGLQNPPAEPIRLWGNGGCGIWVSDEWGPAVPYPPVDHRDGNFNYGYLQLKGNAEAVNLVQEAQGWPELQAFLETVNAGSSPIESVGCEKGFFPGEGEGAPPVKLGSYVDVVFTERALNDRPENFLLLAGCLANAIEGCEKWRADVSFVLQRNRALVGASMPWGLMVQMKNYGCSEEEARKFWGVTLSRLGSAIAGLPRDLRYDR